jgi:hypothetical protein
MCRFGYALDDADCDKPPTLVDHDSDSDNDDCEKPKLDRSGVGEIGFS